MKTLDEIGVLCGTDKCSRRHNYLEVYEKYLLPLRDKEINLLEIGVAEGCSLRMWKEYFQKGNIYGLDFIDRKVLEEDRIVTLKANQASEFELTEALGTKKFDIIIDDASHIPSYQQASITALFDNYLKENGIYIIEDLFSSYTWLQNSSEIGIDNPLNTIYFIKEQIDGLNACFHGKQPEIKTIQSIHAYRSMVVFLKGSKIVTEVI